MTTLAIAGWRTAIECDSARVDQYVRDSYGPFVVADGDGAAITLQVSGNPPTSSLELEQVRMTRQGAIGRFDVAGACGRIDFRSWKASLNVQDVALDFALKYFLRALYAYRVFHDGGLLFHCAGLVVEGRSYLFTGQSGTGKSTVVELSAQAAALNDDMVVLRPVEGRWRAHGTPFWNSEAVRREGQTADGPVAGIYKLVQDQDVFLEPLNTAVASSELVANCPIINADVVTIPGLLRRCRGLAEAVGVQRLHFRKDPAFWSLLALPRTAADCGKAGYHDGDSAGGA